MTVLLHEKVKDWLETTIENSDAALDHGWTVQVSKENEKRMIIDTPKMPFKLLVQVDDDLTYTAFITGLSTKDLPPEQLATVFRHLLTQNRHMGLSKFCLLGDDDTICLRTDLYSKYMNKDEFNMALEAVILGGRWLIAELGQTEDQNRLVKEMASLGSAELLKGTSKKDVVAKMAKAGLEEDDAKALVNELAVELGLESKPETPEEGTDKKEEDEKDNPVHRYIW